MQHQPETGSPTQATGIGPGFQPTVPQVIGGLVCLFPGFVWDIYMLISRRETLIGWHLAALVVGVYLWAALVTRRWPMHPLHCAVSSGIPVVSFSIALLLIFGGEANAQTLQAHGTVWAAAVAAGVAAGVAAKRRNAAVVAGQKP